MGCNSETPSGDRRLSIVRGDLCRFRACGWRGVAVVTAPGLFVPISARIGNMILGTYRVHIFGLEYRDW